MTPVIPQPPATYERPAQAALVYFMPQDEVHRSCGLHKPGAVYIGCAIAGVNGGLCIVTLPTPSSWRGTGEAYRELVDHELGHCAGWPANHPSR